MLYPGWVFSDLLTDGVGKCPPFPKICHTYPAMMKFDNNRVAYLKKMKKIV